MTEEYHESNDAIESESETSDEEGDWEDWESGGENDEEEDEEPARSLFTDKVLRSPGAAMQHDSEQHGFDLRAFAIKHRLEEYDIFRCINWIRQQVRAGVTSPQLLLALEAEGGVPWRGNDDMLKPTLEDDALLFHDYEDVVATWRADLAGREQGTAAAVETMASNERELLRLRDENNALKEALTSLASSCMPDELREEASSDFIPARPSSSSDPSTAPHCSHPPATAAPAAAASTSSLQSAGRGLKAVPLSPSAKEVDRSYFDSYGGFGIHQDMISDKPRTDAYQRALEANPSLVKGKAVLDVGCGTGILSLFACRAGAAKVVSVEGNERMAGFARQISKANGFSSETGGPMTVVQGKLEELGRLPGVDKVDVLVSEWMGYALLFETMLDTVLQARDRWLKPGGAMLPDIATIHVAGASAGATGLQFWKDVYGFDMSPIAEEVRRAEAKTANVLVVKPTDIITNAVQIKELDLCTMRASDQDFSAEFALVAAASSSSGPLAAAATARECHAIVLWFDTDFSSRHCVEAPVRLSTSPSETPTHWAQTVLVLQEPVLLTPPLPAEGGASASERGSKAAEFLTGRISMVRNRFKHRFLDISLEYQAQLGDGRVVKHTNMYTMSVGGGGASG